MADDIQPPMPATAGSAAERDFITDMRAVINVCAVATQLMDLRATEDAVRQSRSIYNTAEKSGYAYLGLLKILQLIIQVLANYAEMGAYQLEARFAEAITSGNSIIADSAEALGIINKMMETEEPDDDLVLIRQTLEYYNTLGPASLAYIQAEQVGITGKLEEYRAALMHAAGLFKKIESLEYSDDASLQQLYANGTNMAERLANRARYFEYIQREKTNQYINPEGKKVFIIHGHSDESAMRLQQLLKDELNLQSVILKNEASSGDSIIEKFENFARDCGYAFAIITSDDLVKKEGEQYFQARPNVLFELGWFYGRYGRSRVCLLKEDGTETPSDLNGIISLGFTKNIKEVYLDMCKELRAAGLIG